MELSKIFFGLIWAVIGNLVMYFAYPVFGAIITAFSSEGIGEFGLSSTITAIGWGGFILLWGFVGLGIPIYFIINGANE